jgi:hypothetical protein
MSNPLTKGYITPVVQHFLNYLIRQIGWILRTNGASVPTCVEAITNVLDVLQGWQPLDAGQGFLCIRVRDRGSLSITIQGSKITIRFIANLPFGLSMQPITVLKLSADGVLLADVEKERFAHLLLRRATWGQYQHNPNVEVGAEWVWTSNLRPSPKWVALRKEALAAGIQPPRAEHWMVDDPQDPYADAEEAEEADESEEPEEADDSEEPEEADESEEHEEGADHE